MAFEGRRAGLQAFLATKQAGANPLAQHLNFKSALKEASIAMAFKARTAEIQRGHDFELQKRKFDQQNTIQTQKDTQQQNLLDTISGGGGQQVDGSATQGGNLGGKKTGAGDVFVESVTIGGIKLNSLSGLEKSAAARKRGQQSVPTPSTTQKEALTEIRTQRQELKRLKNLANSIKFKGPISGRLGNVIGQLGGGEFGATDLKRYTDQLPTTAVSLYRSISGDKRVNNEDAELRAMPLMWQPAKGEGDKLKKKKFADLELMTAAREKLIREGNYFVDEFGQLITPLEAVREKAELEPISIKSQLKAQVPEMRAKGATAYDSDKGFWVDANGNEVR